MLQIQLGNFAESKKRIMRAIEIIPDQAHFHFMLGVVLEVLADYNNAIASFKRALELNPLNMDAAIKLATTLEKSGDIDAAIITLETLVQKHLLSGEAHFQLARLLYLNSRSENTINQLEYVLKLDESHLESHLLLAEIHNKNRNFSHAIAHFNQVLKVNPNNAEILCNLGSAYKENNQIPEALEALEKAITLKPSLVEGHFNRGLVFHSIKETDLALDAFNTTISCDKEYARAYVLRFILLIEKKQLDEALVSCERALELAPNTSYLRAQRFRLKMFLNAWDHFDEELDTLFQMMHSSKKVIEPFYFQAMVDDPQQQLLAAQAWCESRYPENRSLGKIESGAGNKRIRIGYFSGDFHNHPVSLLLIELFELHDRNQFEITAFSFGPDRNDDMRQRIKKTIEHFVDVSAMSDLEIAQLTRDKKIDIAVNLSGYTTDCRSGIFAYRAAPLQVQYLGYPGTLGAPYVDYIVADETVIPKVNQIHFSEKVIYMPDTYWCSDSRRIVSTKAMTKRELGLPESSFIFCCFNHCYKITPDVFDSWMHILRNVENSVLWLLEDSQSAKQNLIREAELRGISGERLKFASRTSPSEYLCRLTMADLFIDSWPYNAHTTANDALYVGLPVLTKIGQAFASRVAASQLTALKIPELITYSKRSFEQQAINLANDPQKLAAIRNKVKANKNTTSLFNTELFTRNLESAFVRILERSQAGLAPEHLYFDQQN
jgi:predicted O-linked N-acetylglucosamine transferase (SPINDLY family)